MKNTLCSAFWTALICLGCSPSSPAPELELAQHGEALNFTTSAGVVSAEAEHFTTNTALGAHTWTVRNESAASGGSSMFASPDNGTINNTGYTTTSPRLDFVTNFTQTGTYQVWVRGRDSGTSSGNSDSVHVGLDGQALTSADRISSFTTAFGWSRSTLDGVNATVNVSTTGQHTVNVWMREDGFIFDKLVLATSTTFTPTGTGPAETPQNTATCGDAVCNGTETCSTCASDCGACPTCTDGIRNGTETGVDCGGTCSACPTCTDGIRNGTETGVDCGGTCAACTTPTASAVWIEAESGTRSGSPTFTVATDSTASGGSYILPPTGSSANSAGTARSTYTVSVAAGTYKLWARVITPNADDDSFWVSVDNGTFVKWNSIPATSAWAWDDVHNSDSNGAVVTYSLTAGSHTITIANREDGARLDKLYLTKNGDTPSGLGGGNGTCSDGIQNQTETGIDCGGPCAACPVCTDGQTRAGTSTCGINGRGRLDQLCSGGQWTNSSVCVDPDTCTDGSTQSGTVSCGFNGRGLYDERCVTGQWQTSTTCVDFDECVDASTRLGTTPCAGGGTLQQQCVTGAWIDSAVCVPPPACTTGQTRTGPTSCGLNNRGGFQQTCVSGNWADSTTCIDPDVCVDAAQRSGSTACGLNGRGRLNQVCSSGQWANTTTCVDSDVCTDGTTRSGTSPCGYNGRGLFDERCVTGRWQDSNVCFDPDECTDASVRAGTTPCGNGGLLNEMCIEGMWEDTLTCVVPNLCTDGILNGTETGVDCGGSCPACPVNAVWIEAESGTRSGSPTFTVATDSTASGGSYVLPPTGSSANSAGTARSTYTVSVAAGTYKLWARVITPNADDDSFWVSVDNGTFVKWNGIPATSTWAWDDVHNSDSNGAVVTYSLTAGSHTITIANREDGARLDKLYLTKNGDTPSGLGGGNGTCSDGIQNQTETGIDCGGPCAACPSCGDGTCNGSESCQTCSSDCGTCAACGDGTCSATESCSTCASDCGACSTWSHQDIGAVGAVGNLTQSGGTFAVVGSGDDIHSTYGTPLDEFHFAYQPVVGDATLVARVVSVQNTNEWAKGGVMIRETLAADAKFAFVFARPDGQVQAQYRAQTATTGTDSGNQTGGTGIKWVMVSRTGDQFRTFYSTDGTNFTQVGSTTTISMAQTVYVGLAVTSHVDGTLCTAQFDDVELSLPATCGDAVCEGSETCTTCAADCGSCGTLGLDARPSNTTCVAPAPLSAAVGFSDVWSAITFTNPMQVVQPPGDSSRLIVVQRAGTARSVPIGATSSAQATNFLTLSNVVTASNGGFLSMAFHPNWAQNRYAYVVYTTSNLMKRLSRFQSTDGGLTLNASTEQVILQSQHQTEFNHNGGQIAFGKDGYLYMSTGDDAYLNYTRARHSATKDNWFGKVLRINVNQGNPYSIPADNPFASGGGSPEVYAYGLRNPWRFSFDRLTGELWLGDVGEDTWEEVNIIQNGGFYGWPYREGDSCFSGSTADCNTPYVSPLYRYTSSAASISGGFVYRGSAMASLYGKYVYGDYVTGEVSIFDRSLGTASAVSGSTAGGAIVGFGEDNAGELYVVRYSTGRIQKLIAQSGGGATDFPAQLSGTGCFSTTNPTQVSSGVIPFSVAQPFWSDGVIKERYLALPNGTTMTIDANGDWEIPPGAVTIKNFRHQGKLFETRFVVRHTNGTYSAYTYEWNDQETQATLVPASGKSRSLPGLNWSYPSRGECFACHTNAANFTLGLETRQLNVNGYYPSTGRTANQLYTLDNIGMLSGNRSSMTPFPAVEDTSVSVDVRAQAYLHVNCSNCHRPGGPGGGPMDARFTTSFANKKMCSEPATLGSLGLSNPVLIAPGDHMGSILWLRMSDRGNPYSMPPLASTTADAVGATLLQTWIDGMAACP